MGRRNLSKYKGVSFHNTLFSFPAVVSLAMDRTYSWDKTKHTIESCLIAVSVTAITSKDLFITRRVTMVDCPLTSFPL